MSKRSSKKAHAGWQGKHALAIAVALVSLTFVSSASAAEVAKPGFQVETVSYPTIMKPGGKGFVVVQVFNTGAGSTSGTVTMTDTLPPGLEALPGAGAMEPGGAMEREEVEEYEFGDEQNEIDEAEFGRGEASTEQLRVWNCSGTTVVTCTTGPGYEGVQRPIKSGYAGRIGIPVKVVGSPETGANVAKVSGGGVSTPAETSNPVTIGTGSTGFGIDGFDGWLTTAEGASATQAGSHPYDLQLNFNLDSDANGTTGGTLRNAIINLPPGIIGNPYAVPRCSRQQFLHGFEACPAETQVGVDRPALPTPSLGELKKGEFQLRLPVYNLTPPPGVPAEFGFTAQGTTILIDAGVRSGSDYGITGSVRNLSYHVVANRITLWGVPYEESHKFERCGDTIDGAYNCGLPAPAVAPQALLTLPSSCEGPPIFHLTADSWKPGEPAASKSFTLHGPLGEPLGIAGCEHLSFSPYLSASPDTSYADTPAGLTVDVKVAQEGLIAAKGVATSNIKGTTVTLPEGVAINPGQAAGLTACGPSEDGLTTEAEKAEGQEDNDPAHCQGSSRVGTDEIVTPLLAKPLQGSVYVMPSNPPHVQLLVTAEGEGVSLKLVGDVHLNEQTGQLVTTFSNTPSLPFTDFKLSFSGGGQAALSTPTRCGTYTTTSDFTPWSSPAVEDLFRSSSFAVTAGTGGAACPASGALPFTPSMVAGSTTDQAGGFTDFSLLLTRQDDQQRIASLKFKTPEGLLGMISKVPLCPEAQANAGTCSNASQIGHTVVAAGPGPYPLVVPQPGQGPAPIYLTEGYKGAPYGLSIVVPLHVGPFVLPTQIVRAKIEVDPRTTELTVTTDPLPQVIGGVPADLRAIDAVIDRPGFMFNPTGCQPGSFSGSATGAEGSNVPISTHFQMGSCKSLTFKPDFKVSTNAKTSRKNGASLDAKIIYPKGPFPDNQASIQSNVKAVKVDLPKQLPSRLTTLQKACPARTFEANPAACPAGSMVGSASAQTPVLPVTLTGPAYFVSYGGAKFPELVIVLQGYGVTVQLHGETFINEHTNITSSTFRQVPDVPIESFELRLPQGPNSALAAIGNLCSKPLKMPTAFTGQNGATLKQSTPITVNGCPKHKHKSKLKAKAHKKK
ncbi:MAG TPA: hypothetical protein VFW38_02205 [Solirubrobacteraceae bacterium]|nr:hypothetical protein [Solirubrobacteraceae bacterium]